MTTFNTGYPIGSTDARDRLDNTENMDYLENSTTKLTHPDRLGTVRKTRYGMEVQHDNQIAAHKVEHNNQMQSFETDFDGRLAGMAFTRVGSFTTGATLTDMRQVLVWESSQGGDGHEYGWAGSFLPSGKVVIAGSSPGTDGGIGAGAWVDRTDVVLRGELLSSDGSRLIGACVSIASLRAMEPITESQRIPVIGYYTDTPLSGGGDFIYDSSDTTTLDDGFMTIVTSTGKRWKRKKYYGFNNVENAGARLNGTSDDTQAIKNTLLSAGKAVIPFGKTTKITSTITIDIKTQSLTSDGAVVDATSVVGEAFRIYSTAATLQERALSSHNKKALYGISLLGVNSPGKFGVIIGKPGSAYANSNDIEINVGFYGFEKQVVFDDNAWRTKLTRCGFEGGAIPFYFNHPSIAGEVIEFDHCWIVDWTVGPLMYNGNFLFNGCSFIGGSTTPIAMDGNAKADFIGCNLEAQADGGYWLTLNGVSKANFIGGQLLVNSNRTKPLIYKATGASLHFQGTSLPLFGSNLHYETTVSYGIKARMMVEGSGSRVTAEGCDLIAGATNDFTVQAVLGGSNLVSNASFENGDVNGWAFTCYGGTGTFTATSTAAVGSSYGGLLTAGANVGCYATQDISIAGEAGSLYSIGMYAKAISGSGTIAIPKLQFFGTNNLDLGTPFSFAVLDTDTAGIWRAYNGVVPDGAVRAVITLDCQQLAGGASVGYDNIWFQTL